MNKLATIVIIMGFWFILPIPFMYMHINDKTDVTMQEIVKNLGEKSAPSLNGGAVDNFFNSIISFITGIWGFIKSIFSIISLYFTILVLGIPDIPPLINYFLGFLKIVSAITLFLLIRGN